MTIAELASRIEQRVNAAREEIARLRDARDAVTAVPVPLAAPPGGVAPSVARGRPRPTANGPRRRRAAARGPKSAIVVALGRELDAGLRNGI